MIASLFLSLPLQAAAPPATSSPPPTPAESAQVRENPVTLFLYYRLRYFHDVSDRLRCPRVAPDRTRALDARYDALYRQIRARFGAAAVDRRSQDRLDPQPGVDCDMNSLGYNNALHQLEQHLAGPAR